jgi:exoribonuclease-2
LIHGELSSKKTGLMSRGQSRSGLFHPHWLKDTLGFQAFPTQEPSTMHANDLQRLAIAAMRTRGLKPEFSAEATLEAEALRLQPPEAGEGVQDLRHLLWFSIDNHDTRDLDQLSWAEGLGDGAARLLVAVADVDVMVRAGGAIDEHAAANTTSVYTAAGVFPMLPETLSTDLSSLHQDEDRLAVVVDMQIAADGSVAGARLYRALVHNHAKLVYEAVSAWLELDPAEAPVTGGAAPPWLRQPGLAEQLRLHDDIATRLRRWRVKSGALSVKTGEPRPVFEHGRLVDLRPDEKNRAKELIADLMIAANGATARFLAARRYPSLRRMLMAPRRWDRIEALARQHGAVLPAGPDALALEGFLQAQRAADPAGFADLSLAVVKLLGSGEYAAEAPAENGQGGTSPGHFGLAVADYAHSTAPNRRYPDLVTQRIVKAALAGAPPPYGSDELTAIARHCTLQEDNARKVERQLLKAAAAVLLLPRIGETFDAIVTGATAKGTFVRIQRPTVEGRVVGGFEGLDVADTVRVRLLAVDAGQGFIDFERA